MLSDKNAPFKILSRKRSNLAHKPWILEEILISLRNKQKMFKTYFIGGSEIAKTLYKATANKFTKVKCLAKKLYFRSELVNFKDDAVAKLGTYFILFCQEKKQKQNNVLKNYKLTVKLRRIQNSLLNNSVTISVQ